MQDAFQSAGQGGDRTAMRDKMTKLRKDTGDKILAVLTPDQTTSYNKMLGTKIDLPQGAASAAVAVAARAAADAIAAAATETDSASRERKRPEFSAGIELRWDSWLVRIRTNDSTRIVQRRRASDSTLPN